MSFVRWCASIREHTYLVKATNGLPVETRGLPVCQRDSGAISWTYAHPAGRKIAALQRRLHTLPVSREHAEYTAERQRNIRGSAESDHVLIYHVTQRCRRMLSYFFTGIRPSWFVCSLSLVKLVRNNTTEKLHQSFSGTCAYMTYWLCLDKTDRQTDNT